MKNYIFAIIIAITTQSIFAQKTNTEYIKNFFIVGGDIATAPAHFDKQDFINLGITLAVTTGAYFADNQVRDFAAHNQSKFNDAIFSMDNYALEIAAVTIGGIGGYGLAANDYKAKELGLKLAEAVFYSEILGEIMKVAAGRSRPYTGSEHTSFNPISFEDSKNSLPSGHTILAFSFATVMASQNDNIFWKIGWYSLATVMSGARLYHDMHWVSDVALGALIGHFIGNFTINHYTNKSVESSEYTFALRIKI